MNAHVEHRSDGRYGLPVSLRPQARHWWADSRKSGCGARDRGSSSPGRVHQPPGENEAVAGANRFLRFANAPWEF